MMFKKLWSILLCICLIMATLTACGGEGAQDDGNGAEGEKKSFIFAHGDAGVADNTYEVYAAFLQEYLDELSGGIWEVEVVGDAVLGTDMDLMTAASMGEIDSSVNSAANMSAIDPNMYFPSLPYLFHSYEEIEAVVSDEEVLDFLHETILENSRVVSFGVMHLGFRNLMLNVDPSRFSPENVSVDEVKGLKIRVSETPVLIGGAEAMGLVPTPLNYSEMVTALQQGTVDGCSMSYVPGNGIKLQDIIKVALQTQHWYACSVPYYSVKFWDSLTEEEQGWFKEATLRACESQRAWTEDYEANTVISKWADEEDVPTLTVDQESFIKATEPALEKFKEQIDPELMNRIEEILNGMR